MIAREIIISSLREWMAEIGKRSSVAVSSDRQSENHGADDVAGGLAVAAGPLRRVCGDRFAVYRGGTDFLVYVPIFECCAQRSAGTVIDALQNRQTIVMSQQFY